MDGARAACAWRWSCFANRRVKEESHHLRTRAHPSQYGRPACLCYSYVNGPYGLLSTLQNPYPVPFHLQVYPAQATCVPSGDQRAWCSPLCACHFVFPIHYLLFYPVFECTSFLLCYRGAPRSVFYFACGVRLLAGPSASDPSERPARQGNLACVYRNNYAQIGRPNQVE